MSDQSQANRLVGLITDSAIRFARGGGQLNGAQVSVNMPVGFHPTAGGLKAVVGRQVTVEAEIVLASGEKPLMVKGAQVLQIVAVDPPQPMGFRVMTAHLKSV